MTNLPDIPSLGIVLIEAPRPLRRDLLAALTMQLALSGPVQVLDGGNCFDGLKLARELRRQRRDYQDCLQRVSVARAFTCYQMAALLAVPPPKPDPILILELLTTFGDENVPLTERQHLLQSCLPRLKSLCRQVPVFISADLCQEPFGGVLETWADQLWQFEEEISVMIQGRLF